MSKPREFSVFDDINFETKHNSKRCIEIQDHIMEIPGSFRAIEYSAYRKIQKENIELEEKIVEAAAALTMVDSMGVMAEPYATVIKQALAIIRGEE